MEKITNRQRYCLGRTCFLSAPLSPVACLAWNAVLIVASVRLFDNVDVQTSELSLWIYARSQKYEPLAYVWGQTIDACRTEGIVLNPTPGRRAEPILPFFSRVLRHTRCLVTKTATALLLSPPLHASVRWNHRRCRALPRGYSLRTRNHKKHSKKHKQTKRRCPRGGSQVPGMYQRSRLT